MSRTTLLDLAKMNGSDAVVGLIEEVQNAAPEVKVFEARTINGTSYTTLIRTGLPTISFRNANGGVTASKSTFATKLVQAFIIGGRIEMDKAILAAHEDGPEALKAIEAAGVAEAGLQKVGSQIYYGVASDAKGFPGLQALVDSALTFDATGSTANTGSSVYAVKMGPRHVQLLFGNNTTLDLSPWRDETLEDAEGKKFPGEVSDLSGWVGLQCVNKNAVARIKNLTAQDGKKLTDSMVAEMLNKFPVGTVPDYLFMNRRSALQLQTSRSTTVSAVGEKSTSGKEVMAPMPTESNGIPIVVTDSIVSTEAIA
jgi:hypothetical protein